MSGLLERAPYGPREDAAFLEEVNALTLHHLAGSPDYARVWPHWTPATHIEGVPYLHAGVFKHRDFKTNAEGIQHVRTLKSSATSSGVSSRIVLDVQSSELQSRSTLAILKDFLGPELRPLLILDCAKSLRASGEVSARVAAAMSLRPLATEMFFLLDEMENAASLNYDRLLCALNKGDDFLVYGFTWMLWMAWRPDAMPADVKDALRGKRLRFVHSGGWKKLEAMRIGHEDLNRTLLEGLHPDSTVVDFYGLVEQVGIIYPMCESGSRHVPIWADVLVRDPFTMEVLPSGEIGMLHLVNTLALGAPYHSVLTEDLGAILEGPCPCGRQGRRFRLEGRIPKAEIRGCANV